MTEVISFIFFFSRFSIPDWVWIQSSPKLNPSSLFPIWVEIKINAKLFSLPIEVDFVIVSCGNLFVVSPWSIADFNSTNTNWKFQHFTSHFNLIRMLILVNLQNSYFSLNDEQNNRNRCFIPCQTNTDVCCIWVEQKLPLLVHLKEKITCLDEKLFLVSFCNLNIFFVIWNQFTCFEISVVS